MPATETAEQCISVFQKLHNLDTRKTKALCLGVFLPVQKMSMRHRYSACLGYVRIQSMKKS